MSWNRALHIPRLDISEKAEAEIRRWKQVADTDRQLLFEERARWWKWIRLSFLVGVLVGGGLVWAFL